MAHGKTFSQRNVSRRLELALWLVAALLVVLLVPTLLARTAVAAL